MNIFEWEECIVNTNINVIAMEQSRTAYSLFSTLCNALNDFSFNKNDKTTEELKAIIKSINVGMPLPSGRYGNSLAVALEMQFYQGALFMIKNANDLEINLESVSSEYDGRNVWDARQTFELSQLGFETTKIADDDDFYKNYPWLIQFKNANIDASLEILNILQDNIKKNGK